MEKILQIREQITALFREVADQQNKQLASLSDDLSLMDTGLDSLCMAIIVAKLEDSLEVDPFNSSDIEFPETVGDFIRLYEHAAA
jgi:acyl carrier protein